MHFPYGWLCPSDPCVCVHTAHAPPPRTRPAWTRCSISTALILPCSPIRSVRAWTRGIRRWRRCAAWRWKCVVVDARGAACVPRQFKDAQRVMLEFRQSADAYRVVDRILESGVHPEAKFFAAQVLEVRRGACSGALRAMRWRRGDSRAVLCCTRCTLVSPYCPRRGRAGDRQVQMEGKPPLCCRSMWLCRCQIAGACWDLPRPSARVACTVCNGCHARTVGCTVHRVCGSPRFASRLVFRGARRGRSRAGAGCDGGGSGGDSRVCCAGGAGCIRRARRVADMAAGAGRTSPAENRVVVSRRRRVYGGEGACGAAEPRAGADCVRETVYLYLYLWGG